MLATQPSAVAFPNPVASSAEPPLGWKHVIRPIEPFLGAVVHELAAQIQAFDPEIVPYAQAALRSQGKQLRPALVALSGGAVGRVNDDHVRVAVIIEMVHLATLVHDDVIDEAQLRRGQPTLAARWGNEISVLLGDCLFAQALQLAASFPTPEICRSVAAATHTVCSGEILQTVRRRKFELSRAEYLKFLQMKTGELFALSCDLGAYWSGAQGAGRAALRQFGMAIGTAYQLYDDCVDVFGSEAVAGKSLGTDLAKGKLTLPILLLLERADARDRTRLEAWMQDWRPDYFPRVAELLNGYGARDDAGAVVHAHLSVAREHLAGVPDNECRRALDLLAQYLAQQTDFLERPA